MKTENSNSAPSSSVIELTVRNHPGAMSHITGLFSRRGFNLEAILCVPLGNGETSSMLLLLAGQPKLDQIERQLEKLFDVLAVRRRDDLDPKAFRGVAGIVGMGLAA